MSKAQGDGSEGTHHPGAPWFEGSVDEAFALAKSGKKPLFFYWGAVWCPPCNELKAQVFSKPRFKELMKPFIPVYLDGDTEDAQFWGERLKASGYPTVIVFDHEGREMMRIAETVSLEEFEAALTGALASGQSLAETIARARQGQATPAEWQVLAYLSWSESDGTGLSDAELYTVRAELFEKVPKDMPVEKALLAASLAVAAAEAKDSDDPA